MVSYGWRPPVANTVLLLLLLFHPAFLLWYTGDRKNVSCSDLSEILPEEVEEEVKAAAEISMGTEVSEEDISNIQHLCDQVRMVVMQLVLGS